MNRIVYCLSVLFTLLSAFAGHTQGTHAYELNLVNLTYGSLTNDVDFNLTMSQDGRMTMNTVLRKASSDYYNQVIVAFQDDNGDYSKIFVNKTIDLCKFLSTPSYEAFIQLYYKHVMKHENNIPTSCPLGGGVHYYVRDVELSGVPVPPFVPSSNAYMQFILMIKETNGEFTKLYGGKVFINFKKLSK